jgi:hypothetical protein
MQVLTQTIEAITQEPHLADLQFQLAPPRPIRFRTGS